MDHILKDENKFIPNFRPRLRGKNAILLLIFAWPKSKVFVSL